LMETPKRETRKGLRRRLYNVSKIRTRGGQRNLGGGGGAAFTERRQKEKDVVKREERGKR